MAQAKASAPESSPQKFQVGEVSLSVTHKENVITVRASGNPEKYDVVFDQLSKFLANRTLTTVAHYPDASCVYYPMSDFSKTGNPAITPQHVLDACAQMSQNPECFAAMAARERISKFDRVLSARK